MYCPLLGITMPGAVERMELRKVVDDDSTDSLDDPYSGPLDSEKVTINRSAQSLSHIEPH